MTNWFQKTIQLKARNRGAHLITQEILKELPELKNIETGLLHLFLQHTSASLSINENADPTVRSDLQKFIDKQVPENQAYFDHTLEGSDDMPAHIKTALYGFELTIPVTKGALNLGTWQGIYLIEHRNHGGARKVVVTLTGK